jgi:hypothetical protein
MRRMIDMIRSSSVSATVMQAAARGALAVPAVEMMEILVYLANHNKVFGQQARMTLAGWDEKASRETAGNPQAPAEVLDYLIAPENLRPRLLPALLENSAVADSKLIEMAEKGSREIVEAMRQSRRVQKSPAILRALSLNPNSTDREAKEEEERTDLAESADSIGLEQASPEQQTPVERTEEVPASAEEDAAIASFLTEHSKELALEGEKPFQPIGGIHEFEVLPESAESVSAETKTEEPASSTAPTATASAATAAAPARKSVPGKKSASGDAERGSALQKISRLDVKGRIQLAMKGNKEERSILIRDSTKLVALGVLENGKVTDGEVEKFASQKNVLEAVLRQIPMKRRFAKNYNVVRNLVANPRTPLDVSLGLMKNILAQDLRNLASNKEVSDTIRKLALKMFKAKTDPSKKSH